MAAGAARHPSPVSVASTASSSGVCGSRPNTAVKRALNGIISKLDANDRTHAVTIALRRGILDL
jgi:hypothetical protein